METRFLEKAEYDKWDTFILNCEGYSIFNSTWLLDAFNVNYRILVAVKNNNWRGGMVLTKNSIGMVTNPIFFKYLGVLIAKHEGKDVTALRNKHKVIEALAERVKGLRSFDFTYHPNFTNWLPFYWRGFRQSSLYTYRIDLSCGMKSIRSNYQKNRKHLLNKALREEVRVADGTSDELYETICSTFKAQKKTMPIARSRIEKFFQLEKNFFCLSAFDANDDLKCSCGVLYDDYCAYLLLNGKNTDAGPANTYLVDSAIEKCVGRSKVFDFEGSMHQRIERFYRAMGGLQTEYFKVSKKSVINTLKDVARALYQGF